MAASPPTGPIGRASKRIGGYVNHDDVLVRFVSLWLAVAGVFTAAWIRSYLFFPQGLLRAGIRAHLRGTRDVSHGSSCGCSGGTSASP
jgi:hypothetical protein